MLFFFFFFNDTATTEIYTLSLHDALPISLAAPNCDRRAEPGEIPGAGLVNRHGDTNVRLALRQPEPEDGTRLAAEPYLLQRHPLAETGKPLNLDGPACVRDAGLDNRQEPAVPLTEPDPGANLDADCDARSAVPLRLVIRKDLRRRRQHEIPGPVGRRQNGRQLSERSLWIWLLVHGHLLVGVAVGDGARE